MTAPIFDHLPQFGIILNMFGDISCHKSNIYKTHWLKFDRKYSFLTIFLLNERL